MASYKNILYNKEYNRKYFHDLRSLKEYQGIIDSFISSEQPHE